MKYPIHLKYNLHKDGSAIWQTCHNEGEYNKHLAELRNDGYNPRIDNTLNINYK